MISYFYKKIYPPIEKWIAYLHSGELLIDNMPGSSMGNH